MQDDTPTQTTERPAQAPRRPGSPAPVIRGASGQTRRLLLGLAIVAAAAGGWWALGRAPEVGLVSPVLGDAAEVVYATGNVEPVRWAKVTAVQRKRIVELCDCEGKTVAQGQVLARLDDAEERAILAELIARLDRHQADAARLKRLARSKISPEATYEEKQTQVREYEARVNAQKERIADLVLRAPMNGVVLRKSGEVGEIAGTGPGDVLFWVGEPLPLRITAEVNEEDILRVKRGQVVLLRHEGHDGPPLRAKVGETTPMGDPASKTFRVYFDLPDDTPLRVGMSVEANVVVREAKGVLLLPGETLGDGQVQVVEAGRVRLRPVTTGIRGTRMVEIVAGVGAGDQVISPFRRDLAEGSRVRPRAGAAP